MGVMKVLLLVTHCQLCQLVEVVLIYCLSCRQLLVSHCALMAGLCSHATTTVASGWNKPAALRPSLCVTMAQTWPTPSAIAGVTLRSQTLRIRIGGLVPMAPRRGVSSRRLAVTGIQIVMMPAMNRIVHWSPMLASIKQSCSV